MRKSSIFRREALAANADRLSGEPFLQYPLHANLIAKAALLIVLLAVLFCYFFEFTQKQAARGILEPEAGLVEVFPQHPGVITSRMPKLGSQVRRGEELVQLQSQPQLTDAALLPKQAEYALTERITSLQNSVERQAGLSSATTNALLEQKRAVEGVLVILDAQIGNAAHQVSLKKTLLARADTLVKEHFVTADFVDQRSLEYKEAQARHQDLLREQAKSRRELTQIIADLGIKQIAATENEQALKRELLNAQAGFSDRKQARSFNITAPLDGTVSALHRLPGQYVASDVPLLTLTPKDSKMRGVLLLPAKAVAFVKPGQTVSLRYSAFPHQYFGSFPGVVRSLETIPYKTEGEQDVAYRVYVDIPGQGVKTASGMHPLSAGMTIDAEIWLARRRLVDWLFTPIYEFFARH